MFQKNMPVIAQIMEPISSNRLQYLVLLSISIVVLMAAGTLCFSNRQLFERFLGPVDPLMVFLGVIVLAFVLLTFLLSKKWFVIFEAGNSRALLSVAAIAVLFGIVMSLLDIRIIFPADMNILFPASLLFYPAIGFLAEVLFHLLPLTLLLLVLNSIFSNTSFNNLVWVAILIVAFIEPTYQAMHMISLHRYPLWAVAFVGMHVFLINLLQLFLFRKYDFVAMFSFRLFYYLVWHIGWGYLRLRWLF